MTEYTFPDRAIMPSFALLFDDTELLPPARRITLTLKTGSRFSFTAPAGVSNKDALASFRAMQERHVTGHSRRIHNIDGRPRRKTLVTAEGLIPQKLPPLRDYAAYYAGVAKSYVAAGWRRLLLHTVRRGEVAKRMRDLDEAIAAWLEANPE